MKETESGGSIAVMTMNANRILEQLSSLKDNSESFASEKDADPIWQNDIEALEAAIAMISTLQDEGVNDAEALKDLLHDYNGLVKQYRTMHQKYKVARAPVRMNGVWVCPECSHRTDPRHSYCHWCGKKLRG